jgi:hypothetical protein
VKVELGPDWTEFLELLTSHRVRFMLVGGHAVASHGEPRFTEDLDVFVASRTRCSTASTSALPANQCDQFIAGEKATARRVSPLVICSSATSKDPSA